MQLSNSVFPHAVAGDGPSRRYCHHLNGGFTNPSLLVSSPPAEGSGSLFALCVIGVYSDETVSLRQIFVLHGSRIDL